MSFCHLTKRSFQSSKLAIRCAMTPPMFCNLARRDGSRVRMRERQRKADARAASIKFQYFAATGEQDDEIFLATGKRANRFPKLDKKNGTPAVRSKPR